MNQKSKYHNWWRSLAVATLLLGYCSAFLLNNLHPFLDHEHHHHVHEHCSDEAEKDPCHRFIVHNDHQAKCSHDGHFINTEHQCDLCDAVVAQFNFPRVKTLDLKIFKSEHSDFTFNEELIFRFSHPNISLRGPPSLS